VIKRIALVPTQVDGSGNRAPTIPAAATGYVVLHDFGPRMLVKYTVPDGTPKTANTIADITLDEDGRQIDVNDEALTPAQQAQAKSFLENQGLDTSKWAEDAVVSRGKLLRFILRRAANWRDMTPRELLDGWDVA
jgi:hypothetical protein